MRKIIVICLMLIAASAFALEYIEIDGQNTLPDFRGSTAYYHNGSDDRHYYYTYEEAENHRWAVRFDFRTYFNNADSTLFAPDSVMIYLPNQTQTGNLTLGLYQDNLTQPADLVTDIETNAANLNTGWNIFPLNASADSVYWLIADYFTDIDHTISASNGDGSHSYFWDPLYGSSGSWRNMQANDFNSEFLFGMKGEFFLTVNDLEVSDLIITGELIPENEIVLSANLINNSNIALEDITVSFNLNFPGYNLGDTLSIQSLAAGDEMEIQQNSSFTLYYDPGRYKFSVNVIHDADEINSNNTIEIYENIFEFERQMLLVENMVELDSDYSNSIWNDQQSLTQSIKFLNIFPSVYDSPYYNFEAEDRYHYYDIYNLPATVADGDVHVGYQESSYLASINETLEKSASENTFIQFTDITAEVDTLNDVYLSVTLERGNHHLLADFYSVCHLKGYIIESNLPFNETLNGTVFLDSIEFATPELSSLANADTLVKTNVFNKIYKFSPIHEDSFEFCSLLFIVQNENDKKVWAVSELPFNDFGVVSSDDSNIVSSPVYRAYPNPFITGNQLKIESSLRSMESEEITVYNLKGQRIKKLPLGRNIWDGTNNSGSPVSSGIYFIRISSDNQSSWLKIAVIR